MTVIAWRAGIMACDSCWTFGSTQVASVIKIKRLSSGALLGSAGDNDCRALEQLLDRVKSPDKLPSRDQILALKTDFIGLLALPRGGVWIVAAAPTDEAGWVDTEHDPDAEAGVWPATTMGGYAAVGSGFDHALAAMDAGATAKQAVEIACRRNVNCRPPVHLRRLLDQRGRRLKAS